MLIAVVVPTHDYWRGFLTRLLDLWQFTSMENRSSSVTIGPLRYIEVNLQFPDKAYGIRADQIIDYNCLDAIPSGRITRRDLAKTMGILSRNDVPIIMVYD